MRERERIQMRGLESDKVWDYENGWFWFASSSRISKLIAHYELYKRCITLPGVIAEFGVYKGNSLLQIAAFREMLELPEARKIMAFDTFGVFPDDNIESQADHDFITRFKDEGGEATRLSDIQVLLNYKGFKNVSLIKGDVRKTFPAFLLDNPQTRFNFVHLDMDVYEPTAAVLPEAFSRLVKGGILMIDDYNAVEGATKAIDHLLETYSYLKIEKLPFSHTPAFIVK